MQNPFRKFANWFFGPVGAVPSESRMAALDKRLDNEVPEYVRDRLRLHPVRHPEHPDVLARREADRKRRAVEAAERARALYRSTPAGARVGDAYERALQASPMLVAPYGLQVPVAPAPQVSGGGGDFGGAGATGDWTPPDAPAAYDSTPADPPASTD